MSVPNTSSPSSSSSSSSSSSLLRTVARIAAASSALVGVLVGLPALLMLVALQRFDHASPLHGVKVPWLWSVADVRSWANRLAEGLDSSAALVDLFFRSALVIGWGCAAVLIYTVAGEMWFQLRHGMPSARRHRFGGLGVLGRKLATVLVAVIPLAITATPALAGSLAPRAGSGVVHHRVADLSEPVKAVLSVPGIDAATVTSPLGAGWSVIEVKRGDSVWSIAERVADGRDIGALAKQIVTANLGTVMNDGHRFRTPALIEPGWLLNVPDSTAAVTSPTVDEDAVELAATPSAQSYTVLAGDSYWGIAEDHLAPSASPAEIFAFTNDLMSINAPALGYSDERLIRPGDVLQFRVPDEPTVLPAVAAPGVDTPTPAVESSPPIATEAATTAATTTPADVPVVSLPLPARSDPPSTTPASEPTGPTATAVIDQWSSKGFPVRRGLASAVLLCGGAVAVLDSRRRQRLRSASIGARLLAPGPEAVETETVLRSLGASQRLARVDLALRCAAPALAHQQARVLAVEIADDGEILLHTDRPAVMVADRWLLDIEAGAWRLSADVSLTDLAGDARRTNPPSPAIVHIGRSAGGDLFVDLEAIGVLSIDAAPEIASSIVRYAAASLAVSPFMESSRIFTVGLDGETHLGSSNVESHDTLESAVEAVRATVGSIVAATSGTVTTMALRVAAHGGEAWEPSLLLSVGANDAEELVRLVALAAGGGRGVGVMVDRSVVGSGAVLRAADGNFVLEPLGRRVEPVGVTAAEVAAVADLLESAQQPLMVAVDVDDHRLIDDEFGERAQSIIVQVFGEVAVQAVTGESIVFDRSKAQEPVVWLSQHRRRPTRASARTALWDVAVRDATFSNVVSDARRSMAKVVTPPSGQEWLARTMNEDLPLHDLVVSDAELLADRMSAARGLAGHEAIAILRPGVALVHGMPFAGTAYLWPDAEGITSSLVLLATSAAAELAAHYLAAGDIEGVFWATGQGLKVLAGHEELIALRMRAHAYRGDLAGVRNEWDSYERAVSVDVWSAADPSPKLVDLRRELLAPPLAS